MTSSHGGIYLTKSPKIHIQFIILYDKENPFSLLNTSHILQFSVLFEVLIHEKIHLWFEVKPSLLFSLELCKNRVFVSVSLTILIGCLQSVTE